MPMMTTAPKSAFGLSSKAQHDVRQSRILIIDDEQLNIDVVQGYLELDGYENIESTQYAIHALSLIGEFRPDLVLLDIHMPEINGLEILRAIRTDPEFSATPVIVLTASSTSETKLVALRTGATDLLSKPVHEAELLARIQNVLTVKSCHDRLRQYSEELEEAVRERTADLEASRLEVIHCLARAAEFRDDDTGKHVIRVGRYARIIGQQLRFAESQLEILELAAQLHDIGKIGIPDAILMKPGKLTTEEYEVMRKHCGFGKRIVDCLPAGEDETLRGHVQLGEKIMDFGKSPILNLAKRIAMTHHERWDGKGYPLGLAGEDIPIEGRITAVADVFDALSSKRSYKDAFPLQKCFEIIEEGSGTQFDPQVVNAFLHRREKIVQVQIELIDTE